MTVLPIVRTARAEEDLIEIWLHIAKDNPAAADAVLDLINERWTLLTEHPYLGMARDDIAPGIRHMIVGAYVTFYRVGTEIEILRVLHGARDYTRIEIGE